MTGRAIACAGLTALGLIACSAGDGEHTGTETTSSAIVVGESATFDQNALNTAIQLSGLSASQVGFANSAITFTPSSALSRRLYKDDPNGAAHMLSFPVPGVNYSPPSPLPDIYVTLTSFNSRLADATVTLNGSEIDADVIVTGSAHVHTSSFVTPDADVILDASHVTATFVWDSTHAQFKITNAGVDLQDHVENCGAFGWCDGLLHHNLPDMSGTIRSAILSTLGKELTNYTIAQGFYSVINDMWNLGHQSDNGGGPAWYAVTSTIKEANSVFTFNVTRDVNLTTPQCTFALSCPGDAVVPPELTATCTSVVDFFRGFADGTRTPLGTAAQYKESTQSTATALVACLPGTLGCVGYSEYSNPGSWCAVTVTPPPPPACDAAACRNACMECNGKGGTCSGSKCSCISKATCQ